MQGHGTSIGKPTRACHACRPAGISVSATNPPKPPKNPPRCVDARSRRDPVADPPCLVQCDRRIPGCTQCEVIGRKCPGYGKSGEFVFLNQNEYASKASFRARNRKVVKNISVLGAKSEVLAPRTLWGASQEDHAICYFLATHVARTGQHGFLDMVPELYTTKDKDLPLNLKACIEALAYASFANRSHDLELATIARQKYSLALRLTNEVLKDDKIALQDPTLLTVSLLRMFETMTGVDQKSLVATREHVRGAATLVGLRGTRQLESPLARRLFVHVIISAASHCVALTPDVLAICRELHHFLDPQDPTMKLFRLVLATFELQMALRDDPNTGNPRLVSVAFQLDGVLNHFCQNPPSAWRYSVHDARDARRSNMFFRRKYHAYPDLGVASVWHAIWIMRWRIHSCIRQMMLSKYEDYSPELPDRSDQLEASLQLCRDMHANILASVPQFTGFVQRIVPASIQLSHSNLDAFGKVAPPRSPSSSVSPESSPESTSDEQSDGSPRTPSQSSDDAQPNTAHVINDVPLIRPYAGHMLIWPLWYAASSEEAEEDTRAYAAKMLYTIGRSMGVNQACYLAEALTRGSPGQDLALLGDIS